METQVLPENLLIQFIDKTEQSKAFIKYMLTLPFLKVIEQPVINDNIPNNETVEAVEAVERGEVNKAKNVNDLIFQLEN